MLIKIVWIFTLSLLTHAQEKPWQGKMRNVSNAMSEVVPYLYPSPDKDIKGLTEKVKKLYEASEQLDVIKDHMIKTGDFDPGLIYLANSFKDDIDRAYSALNEGYTDYARYVLKDSTAYCIGCHTRTTSGAQFPLLKAFADPLKSAPWITRIEFMAASRQFDAVFDEVLKELQKPKSQSVNLLDLERGSRLALSIAIRVKNDPQKALKLAKAVEQSKNSNFPMKEGAKDWRQEILAWQKEKPKKYQSSLDMIEDARSLIAKAEKSPSRGHDEVYYLRATQLLHELLKRYTDSRDMPEAFYLLGVSYRPLLDLGLWNLQDKYFRACILEAPHTALAEKCYKSFEESTISGFSGSSGIQVPPQMQRQLQQLKNRAEKPKE